MSRPTEDDQAADLLADLKSRGFRICELTPALDRTYLDGDGAEEWSPIEDRRAIRLLAIALVGAAVLVQAPR